MSSKAAPIGQEFKEIAGQDVTVTRKISMGISLLDPAWGL